MTEPLSLIEQLGLALLVGGVRAIARGDQRRKLELQREGEWVNLKRHAGQLLQRIEPRTLGYERRMIAESCSQDGCILPPHRLTEPHVNAQGLAYTT